MPADTENTQWRWKIVKQQQWQQLAVAITWSRRLEECLMITSLSHFITLIYSDSVHSISARRQRASWSVAPFGLWRKLKLIEMKRDNEGMKRGKWKNNNNDDNNNNNKGTYRKGENGVLLQWGDWNEERCCSIAPLGKDDGDDDDDGNDDGNGDDDDDHWWCSKCRQIGRRQLLGVFFLYIWGFCFKLSSSTFVADRTLLLTADCFLSRQSSKNVSCFCHYRYRTIGSIQRVQCAFLNNSRTGTSK